MNKNLPIIAFLTLGLVWGSNFIYMKWAVELITPLQTVFMRVLFGFVPVIVYAYYKNVLRFSHLKYSLHFFIMSLLGTTVYYYFFVKATSLLPSGITGALSGSIPLFTFVLGFIFLKEEKLNRYRILGAIIGFMGVVMIANPFATNLLNTNIQGVISISIGSLVLGTSFIYAKKFISPLNLNFSALATYQLGFALLSLFFVTDFNGISNVFTSTHVFLGLVIGLGLLGTGLAFIIYYYIVETLGAVNASSVTYIPPIVALFIGYVFVGESISFMDFFGTFCIFTGVFLINKKIKNEV